MPLIPDTAVFQKRLAALPLQTYQAGETVFAAGASTGRLLILRQGAVKIVKGGVEIAKVAEPGAVFGELSALLDQPHTADVLTLETSQFHVADAAALLVQDPIALLYVPESFDPRTHGYRVEEGRAAVEKRDVEFVRADIDVPLPSTALDLNASAPTLRPMAQDIKPGTGSV